MRTPLLMILAFFLLIAQSAIASDYSETKKNAYSDKSKVYDAFIESYDNQTPRAIEESQSDFFDLAIKKRESGFERNIDIVIVERFPEYSSEKIMQFAKMSESDLLAQIENQISESDLINIVLARSKKLSTAESNWKASLYLYPQTTYLQDLLIRFNSFSEGMSIGIGKDYNREMVQMMQPFPGMLSLRGRIVDLDIDIAWQKYNQEIINVISDSKSTLADIRTKRELLEINKSSESLLRELHGVIDAQYRSGTRTFSDLIRIKTELEKRSDTVSRIESMIFGLYSQLASQMDCKPDIEFGDINWDETGNPEFDYSAANETIRESNPDLNEISLKNEKMKLMIEMSRLNLAPDLTLGLTFYQSREVDRLDSKKTSDMEMGQEQMQDMEMTQMNFMDRPMVDYKNNTFALETSWLAELIERQAAMSQMLDAKTNMISGMLSMQYEKFQRNIDSENTYKRRIIPDSKAALEVVRKGYSSDENNFNDLISSEMALIMARMELANIQNEKLHSEIEIERMIGHSLIMQSLNEEREVN